MTGFDEAHCPRFQYGMEVIGRRWTGAILNLMLHGATRYSEIKERIPGLTDRLLSDRLKELEAEGIVDRVVTPEIPVSIRYHLTEKGRELVDVLDSVGRWTTRWVELPAEQIAQA
ncbi:MAG TPA: helix-turn-helix domain-containing protein [Candidatus Dormibacteraeota bacterium]|jgi:DNA-binding HxlR family transcriptional regulator|nr:helix-turn-helix domain-containing protein [Candidatus Dormibacteraeota bacterium]